MILTHPERLLLETVRGAPHRRQAAWEERKKLYPLPTFPNPAAQLLCLVAGEWSEQGEERLRLRGILRHTWVNNQSKLSLARRLGQEVVWLGDLALTLSCYQNAAHRPIQALEGWVKQSRLEAVSTSIEQRGFPVVWRNALSAFHCCPTSNISIRLVTRLLPNRPDHRSPDDQDREGLRLLSPETLLLRLCLARPHNAWWIADLLTLVPQLSDRQVASTCEEYRAGLAVRRTIARINRLGFAPLQCDLRQAKITPGEWPERWLGERGLAAHLLTVDQWQQVPGALWSFFQRWLQHRMGGC